MVFGARMITASGFSVLGIDSGISTIGDAAPPSSAADGGGAGNPDADAAPGLAPALAATQPVVDGDDAADDVLGNTCQTQPVPAAPVKEARPVPRAGGAQGQLPQEAGTSISVGRGNNADTPDVAVFDDGAKTAAISGHHARITALPDGGAGGADVGGGGERAAAARREGGRDRGARGRAARARGARRRGRAAAGAALEAVRAAGALAAGPHGGAARGGRGGHGGR
jgi:hypothetical protein